MRTRHSNYVQDMDGVDHDDDNQNEDNDEDDDISLEICTLRHLLDKGTMGYFTSQS